MPPTIEQTLTELATRHAAPLASLLHSERAAALHAAQAAITTACDRELQARQEAIVALQKTREARLAAAAQASETTRRARADALLAEIFARGPGSLSSLIHEFRIDPTRPLAVKARSLWDSFNARALSEIGSAIAPNVLAQLVCDDVLAADGFAAAANGMSDLQFGTFDALYRIAEMTTAQTPRDIENALLEAEQAMVAAAKRYVKNYPGTVATPEHLARHALRRSNITYADLSRAREELDRVQGNAAQAAFERSYTPPDSLSTILRRQVGLTD